MVFVLKVVASAVGEVVSKDLSELFGLRVKLIENYFWSVSDRVVWLFL